MLLRHDSQPRKAVADRSGWEIGEITRRHETALAVSSNRNYNTAAGFLDPANVGRDFRSRDLSEPDKTLLQPFGKSLPAVPPYDLDRLVPSWIAQTHKREIQLERSDQQIGEVGGNGGRFSSHPCLWDRRKRQEIPDR